MKLSGVMSFAVLGTLVVLAGCATGGSNPQDAVAKQIDGYVTATQNQDVDGIMAVFSEDFEHYEWGDKAGAEEFMSEANDMGYLEDIEVFLEDMEIDVDGDGGTATAYPIEMTGAFGSITLELTFTNEDGTWLVTGLDASGL